MVLSLIVKVLPAEMQFGESAQGNITLKGENGSISSRGSIMIVLVIM